MKYLCLVYQDERKLAALTASDHDVLVDETRTFDQELQDRGHCIASTSIELVQAAASIRVWNGRVAVTEGPFVESTGREQLAGYFLVEARDLNEAIRVASRMPSARMGGVEVRPVADPVCP